MSPEDACGRGRQRHFGLQLLQKFSIWLEREKFQVDTTVQEARHKACFFRGVDRAFLTASAYTRTETPFSMARRAAPRTVGP